MSKLALPEFGVKMKRICDIYAKFKFKSRIGFVGFQAFYDEKVGDGRDIATMDIQTYLNCLANSARMTDECAVFLFHELRRVFDSKQLSGKKNDLTLSSAYAADTPYVYSVYNLTIKDKTSFKHVMTLSDIIIFNDVRADVVSGANIHAIRADAPGTLRLKSKIISASQNLLADIINVQLLWVEGCCHCNEVNMFKAKEPTFIQYPLFYFSTSYVTGSIAVTGDFTNDTGLDFGYMSAKTIIIKDGFALAGKMLVADIVRAGSLDCDNVAVGHLILEECLVGDVIRVEGSINMSGDEIIAKTIIVKQNIRALGAYIRCADLYVDGNVDVKQLCVSEKCYINGKFYSEAEQIALETI